MERNYKIETVCPCCRKTHALFVNIEDHFNWAMGRVLTQVAFPYLNPDEREMLISGVCSSCWDMMFGDDEKEKEEEF